MRISTRILLPMIGLLVFTGCPALEEPEPTVTNGMAEYQNEEYGYLLTYPDTLVLVEHSPEHLSLVRPEGEDVAEIEIGLFKTEADQPRPPSFEEFVYERARALCGREGPDQGARCTDVVRPTSFDTVEGLQGHAFHLRYETFEPGVEGILEEDERGPFYAVDVSPLVPDAWFAALIIRPPVAREPDAVRGARARELAESVRLVAFTPEATDVEQAALIHELIREDDRPYLVVDFVDLIEDAAAPGGYRIENPGVMLDTLAVAPGITITMYSYEAPMDRPATVALDDFHEALHPVAGRMPFRLELLGDRVVAITEQYLPQR